MQDCRKTKLSNGLEVLLIPNKASPVVALQGWIRYGAADEARDGAGVAHLFEHLLFKGTHKRAVGEIAREVEGLGGDINAYTSYDHTVMHMTLPASAAHQGIDILADALVDSIVDEDELTREKEVILEEIRRRNDMPSSVASDLLRAELYGKHPYAQPVIGYADVVKAMPREKILTEYKRYYNTRNLFLVIAGDFNEGEILQTCEACFRGLKDGNPPEPRPAILPNPVRDDQNRRAFAHHPSPDTLLHLGWLATDGTHADCAALDAYALILGQGESSRLTRKLVHDSQFVRDIGSGVWTPKDRGYFGISFKGATGTAAKLGKIVDAIEECLRTPVSEAELEKAKRNLLSSAIYSKETVDGLAQRFGYYESLARNWELDGEYLKQVRALTVQDLEHVKREYLAWEKVVSGGIVNEKEKLPEFRFPTTPKPKISTKKTSAKETKTGVETFNFRGLKVILRHLPNLPIFSMRWVGLGGTRLEPTNKSGLGALWARTVSEGGRSADGKLWSREELNELTDRSSASLSAFHGKNSWGFQADGLSDDFEKLFMILCATKEAPSFDKRIVSEEKTHQLMDIKSSKDSPGSVVNKLFSSNLFGKHPYGRFSLGSPESLRSVAPKDLASYHAKLQAQAQVLTVVGDIDRAQLERCLEKYVMTAHFARKSDLLKTRKTPLPAKSLEIRAHLKKEQSHILTGFPTCSIYSEDRWALAGLAAVLAGQGGRLFLELRDKMSLCYSVYPSRMEALDGGYFGFYIATSPDKERTALEALDREIRKVVDEGVPLEEWQRAKQFLVGSHEIEFQHYHGQASEFAMNELYGVGFGEMFEYAKRLNAVTPKDLARVAKKYFRNDNKGLRVTAIVSPAASK